jgi:hypothetical protein
VASIHPSIHPAELGSCHLRLVRIKAESDLSIQNKLMTWHEHKRNLDKYTAALHYWQNYWYMMDQRIFLWQTDG